MKTKTFILIMVFLIAASCRKQQEETLPPFLDIKFDNLPLSSIQPGGQDSVFADYFVSPLRVHILENNLEQFKLKNSDIEFAFQITTPVDSEVYLGKNMGVSGGISTIRNYIYQVDLRFDVYLKLSDSVKQNNNLIEYRKESDYIKVQCRSGYSGRIARKTLINK